MFCPNCGAENEADAKVCRRCGFDIEHDNPMDRISVDYAPKIYDKELSKSKTTKIKENKRLIGGILLIIIFFVAAYAGMSYLTQTPYKEITIMGASMEVPNNEKVTVDINSSSYAKYVDKKYCVEVYSCDESNTDASNFKQATEFAAAKKIAQTYVYSVEVDNVYLNKSSDDLYSYEFKYKGKDFLISSGSSEYVSHAVKTLKFDNGCTIYNLTGANSNTSSSNDNASSSASVSNNTTPTGALKIQNISFSTAREIDALTYIKLFVGADHAGDSVKISAVFSNKNNALCEEKVLTKKVDANGYVNFESIKAFAKFPDHAIVKIYTADGTLADMKDLTLVPRAGTQSF